MVDIVKEYAAKRLDLLKLEATEKSSLTAGVITLAVLLIVSGFFFIILFNIGLGFWIGSLLGNYAYGLLIMAGFYLILMIVFFLSRNYIKNTVANKVIKALNS